jgi:hypothetical protein
MIEGEELLRGGDQFVIVDQHLGGAGSPRGVADASCGM